MPEEDSHLSDIPHSQAHKILKQVQKGDKIIDLLDSSRREGNKKVSFRSGSEADS
jgi:hypothetical protein